MPLDDSTWVIHSLPRSRTDDPVPSPDTPRYAFRSVLSPWRDDERPARAGGQRDAGGDGPRGTSRAAS